MRILVACEESQRVCCAFRNKGHEAYSCDLQPCSGGHPEWHIMGNCLPLLNGHCTFLTEDCILHSIGTKWDMIIAHPPCTFLCRGSAVRMYPSKGCLDFERYSKMLSAAEFFMLFLTADCDKICVENPIPLSIAPLPPATQTIQPYFWKEFADENFTKATNLWLKNLKPLVAKTLKDDLTKPFVNCGSKRRKQGIAHSAKMRAKTFLGVANAMAEQWGGD